MCKLLNDLLNGLIGKVIEEGVDEDGFSWDEDENVLVDGKELYIGEEVCGIDEFVFDEKELVLFRGDGYSGVCCYNGMIKKDNVWYWLDIVGEYMVYEMEGDE